MEDVVEERAFMDANHPGRLQRIEVHRRAKTMGDI